MGVVTGFPIRPRKGTAILFDDQPGETVGGVALPADIGCRHLDFVVVALHPDDDPGFGVGSTVLVDDPNVAGDMNHRRMIDGVVYRAVPLKDIVAVME